MLRNLICPAGTRIDAIKLFTEISIISLDDEEEQMKNHYKEKTCMYYCIFIEQIQSFTHGRDLRQERATVIERDNKQLGNFENFVKQVAIAISSVFK